MTFICVFLKSTPVVGSKKIYLGKNPNDGRVSVPEFRQLSQVTRDTLGFCYRLGNTAEIDLLMFYTVRVCRIKSEAKNDFFILIIYLFLFYELLSSCLLSKAFDSRSRKLSGLINKTWMRGETALNEEQLFTFKDRKQKPDV